MQSVLILHYLVYLICPAVKSGLNEIMEYFLLGFLSPILLNILHLSIGLCIVAKKGNVYSLAFSTLSFFTKTLGLIFLTWLGVDFLHLNFKIYIPILTLSWLTTHLIEAFTIQSNLRK